MGDKDWIDWVKLRGSCWEIKKKLIKTWKRFIEFPEISELVIKRNLTIETIIKFSHFQFK